MTLVVPEGAQLDQLSRELWYVVMRRQQLLSRQTVLLEMEKFLKNNSVTDEPGCVIPEKKDLVFSGVCVLPSVTPRQSLITEQPASDLTSTGSSPESSDEVVAVQDLSFFAATVYCPNCQQQVTTEIHYKVGRSSFLVCFLSISLG
ncbi:hypothetical protein MHYP_G00161520 [Metynnis hypsauchen]